MTMLHQHRNDAQPQMKSCVQHFFKMPGFGDVSQTSDL